nr:MAG TPA: hypothetical protein [Bacteriophage sp.]
MFLSSFSPPSSISSLTSFLDLIARVNNTYTHY